MLDGGASGGTLGVVGFWHLVKPVASDSGVSRLPNVGCGVPTHSMWLLSRFGLVRNVCREGGW